MIRINEIDPCIKNIKINLNNEIPVKWTLDLDKLFDELKRKGLVEEVDKLVNNTYIPMFQFTDSVFTIPDGECVSVLVGEGDDVIIVHDKINSIKYYRAKFESDIHRSFEDKVYELFLGVSLHIGEQVIDVVINACNSIYCSLDIHDHRNGLGYTVNGFKNMLKHFGEVKKVEPIFP